MNGAVAIAGSRTSRLRLVVGIVIGLLLPLVAGEAYVRLLPPAESSHISGIHFHDQALTVPIQYFVSTLVLPTTLFLPTALRACVTSSR